MAGFTGFGNRTSPGQETMKEKYGLTAVGGLQCFIEQVLTEYLVRGGEGSSCTLRDNVQQRGG